MSRLVLVGATLLDGTDEEPLRGHAGVFLTEPIVQRMALDGIALVATLVPPEAIACGGVKHTRTVGKSWRRSAIVSAAVWLGALSQIR